MHRAAMALVTVLDVFARPDEFARSHVPGALNIPLEDWSCGSARLTRPKEVMLIAAVPNCVIVLFRSGWQRFGLRGFKARRLEDWPRLNGVASGFPIETSHT